eukprot:CFRG0205T1
MITMQMSVSNTVGKYMPSAYERMYDDVCGDIACEDLACDVDTALDPAYNVHHNNDSNAYDSMGDNISDHVPSSVIPIHACTNVSSRHASANIVTSMPVEHDVGEGREYRFTKEQLAEQYDFESSSVLNVRRMPEKRRPAGSFIPLYPKKSIHLKQNRAKTNDHETGQPLVTTKPMAMVTPQSTKSTDSTFESAERTKQCDIPEVHEIQKTEAQHARTEKLFGGDDMLAPLLVDKTESNTISQKEVNDMHDSVVPTMCEHIWRDSNVKMVEDEHRLPYAKYSQRSTMDTCEIDVDKTMGECLNVFSKNHPRDLYDLIEKSSDGQRDNQPCIGEVDHSSLVCNFPVMNVNNSEARDLDQQSSTFTQYDGVHTLHTKVTSTLKCGESQPPRHARAKMQLGEGDMPEQYGNLPHDYVSAKGLNPDSVLEDDWLGIEVDHHKGETQNDSDQLITRFEVCTGREWIVDPSLCISDSHELKKEHNTNKLQQNDCSTSGNNVLSKRKRTPIYNTSMLSRFKYRKRTSPYDHPSTSSLYTSESLGLTSASPSPVPLTMNTQSTLQTQTRQSMQKSTSQSTATVVRPSSSSEITSELPKFSISQRRQTSQYTSPSPRTQCTSLHMEECAHKAENACIHSHSCISPSFTNTVHSNTGNIVKSSSVCSVSHSTTKSIHHSPQILADERPQSRGTPPFSINTQNDHNNTTGMQLQDGILSYLTNDEFNPRVVNSLTEQCYVHIDTIGVENALLSVVPIKLVLDLGSLFDFDKALGQSLVFRPYDFLATTADVIAHILSEQSVLPGPMYAERLKVTLHLHNPRNILADILPSSEGNSMDFAPKCVPLASTQRFSSPRANSALARIRGIVFDVSHPTQYVAAIRLQCKSDDCNAIHVVNKRTASLVCKVCSGALTEDDRYRVYGNEQRIGVVSRHALSVMPYSSDTSLVHSRTEIVVQDELVDTMRIGDHVDVSASPSMFIPTLRTGFCSVLISFNVWSQLHEVTKVPPGLAPMNGVYRLMEGCSQGWQFINRLVREFGRLVVPMNALLDLKMALLLQLATTYANMYRNDEVLVQLTREKKITSSVTEIRPDNLDVLVLSNDPEIAKLCAYVASLVSQSTQYTAGTTGSQFMPMSLPSSKTNPALVSGGSLLLAGRGLCLIHEFGRMKNSEMICLARSLESGTFNVVTKETSNSKNKVTKRYPLCANVLAYESVRDVRVDRDMGSPGSSVVSFQTTSTVSNRKTRPNVTEMLKCKFHIVSEGSIDGMSILDGCDDILFRRSCGVDEFESITCEDLSEFLRYAGSIQVEYSIEALNMLQAYYVSSFIDTCTREHIICIPPLCCCVFAFCHKLSVVKAIWI